MYKKIDFTGLHNTTINFSVSKQFIIRENCKSIKRLSVIKIFDVKKKNIIGIVIIFHIIDFFLVVLDDCVFLRYILVSLFTYFLFSICLTFLLIEFWVGLGLQFPNM